VRWRRATGCAGEVTVALAEVAGLDHRWGRGSADGVDTTALAWDWLSYLPIVSR